MSSRASAIRHASAVCLFAISLLFASSSVFAQSRASSASADLDQLVQMAQTIVRGSVVSARVEPHPQFRNIQTVVVTVAVTKLLKGAAGSTLTFRQYLWDMRDASIFAGYKGAGEVLLFLNPVSPYGLTSPTGLEQGRFRVLRDNKGNRYVLNGRGNMGLFNQVVAKAEARGVSLSKPITDMMAKTGGQVSLEVFEQAVQSLAGASK